MILEFPHAISSISLKIPCAQKAGEFINLFVVWWTGVSFKHHVRTLKCRRLDFYLCMYTYSDFVYVVVAVGTLALFLLKPHFFSAISRGYQSILSFVIGT